MEKVIKYLGSVNGWEARGVPRPPELEACELAQKAGEKHQFSFQQIRRGTWLVTCHTCGISYDIDSSD